MFLHSKLIRNLLDFCNGLFAKAAYATSYVPTYPCGQIGYVLASKNQVRTWAANLNAMLVFL